MVAAVLSGNRNFEGRVHPQVRANYLASPPLVVAYALAGSMRKDLTTEPLGKGKDGKPVYLQGHLADARRRSTPRCARRSPREMFKSVLRRRVQGRRALGRDRRRPAAMTYSWDDSQHLRPAAALLRRHDAASRRRRSPTSRARASWRCSAIRITTDHISPGRLHRQDQPGRRSTCIEHGVEPQDFNQYGARRGNHEVMMRGTFANIRIRNEMLAGKEGG